MFLKNSFATVSLFLYFALMPNAYANFDEFVLDKTKAYVDNLGFTEKFLTALKTCSPIKEKRQEMGMEVTYELKGFDKNGNCQIISSSQMQEMSAITTCLFDKDDLNLFIESQYAVRELIAKAKSVNEIISDERYLISVVMMMDEEKCSNKRSAYDPTKELRENLKNCTPYETQIDIAKQGHLSMQVVGKQGDKCHYIFKVYSKAPAIKDIKKLFGEEHYQSIKEHIKDKTITTACYLTEVSKNKYIEILSRTAIPEGDAFDTDVIEVSSAANKEAANFLSSLPECEMAFD